MFERYTERARRVIFFARYETSMLGGTTIESEHFLLGLLREETNLLQQLLQRPDIQDEMRARIKARITTREKVPTTADLPLSEECKRILKYSEEEAGRLNHRSIATEHLLLGVLREKGCLAEQLLTEAGVSLDAARDAVRRVSPPDRPMTPEPSMPAVSGAGTLGSIHALVDRLPHDRLPWLKLVIDQLLNGEPYPKLDVPEVDVPEVKESPRMKPENWQTEERTSSVRRMQDGSIVVETQQALGPSRVSVKEQFQLSPDGRKLRYSHEVTGPRPVQRHTQSYDFDAI